MKSLDPDKVWITVQHAIKPEGLAIPYLKGTSAIDAPPQHSTKRSIELNQLGLRSKITACQQRLKAMESRLSEWNKREVKLEKAIAFYETLDPIPREDEVTVAPVKKTVKGKKVKPVAPISSGLDKFCGFDKGLVDLGMGRESSEDDAMGDESVSRDICQVIERKCRQHAE